MLFRSPYSLVALNASGKQVIIAIPKVGIRGQPIQPVETGFGPEWSRGWDFTDMALGSSSQVAVVTAEGRLLQKRSREGNFVSGPFHRSPARSVAFSPSSSRLLVAHADGHVVEYPALSGVAPFRAGSLGPGPWVASRNPSHGPAVLSSSPSSPPLSEWDPSDPALAASPANLGAAPRCFAYAPAQRRFLGVFEDPSVVASFLPDDPSRAMAWNAPKPVQHLWAHPAGPHALVAGTDSLHALLWTGDRWIVAVSREEGGATIAEEREAQRDKLVTDARAEPLVAAVLKRFPGAEIVDVRVRATEADASGDADIDLDAAAATPPVDDEDPGWSPDD